MAEQTSNIPLKNRVAYKQARFVVACALGLGLLFSFVQIYVDFLQQKSDLSQTSLQAISIMKRTAAEAAFHLDPHLADEVAAGLFEYAPFVFVQIDGYLGRNEFSEPLIAKQRQLDKHRFEWLSTSLFGNERKYRIDLTKAELSQPNVGIMVVHVDPYPVAISFLSRSLATVGFGILRAAILALFVFAFFYLDITKPLNRLSDAWLKIEPDSPSPDALPDASNHQDDEIGLIITRARDFLRDHRDNLDRRLAMEQQLIQARDELEQRVERRTADLETQIREKERIQKDLVKAKLLAEEATHAKSVFLATMSHEIRTPLHGVQGMLQVLANDSALTGKQQETLGIIDDSAKLLIEIINDVLDLSKIEAGQLELQQEPISIAHLVSSSATLLESRAKEKDLDLHHYVSPGLPTAVQGDGTRLQQIIINIVGNAIKFTHSGKIQIAVTLDGFEGSLARVRFEISDTGIGLTQKQQQEIFEPFVQVESLSSSNAGGTGLGLSICRKLLALMHGEIGVQSTPGKGSMFWFVIPFPVAESYSENDARTLEEIASSIEVPPLKILLAEDNDVNRKIATELLSSDGHQVQSVSDGQQALDRFRNEDYDVLLIDNHMPKKSGLEVISIIKQMPSPKRDTPIIMLSADAVTQTRELSLQTGALAFLSKPFKHKQLRSVLAKVTNPTEIVGEAAKPPPPVEEPQTSWINTEKLDELRDSIGDNLVLEVLHDVQQQIRTATEQLPRLNAERQASELRMVSHSLLGAARELRFDMISSLCQAIEMASIEERFEQSEQLIQQLISNQKLIEAEIDDYCSRYLHAATANSGTR